MTTLKDVVVLFCIARVLYQKMVSLRQFVVQ